MELAKGYSPSPKHWSHRREGAVVIPNPFYQIYEGAALLAGVQPTLIASDHSTGFLANYRNLSEDDWEACQMLFLCTPGNPSGAVIPENEQVLPKHLDEEVARYMVEGFGGVLTQLTQEQAGYIGVTTEGPYKPEYYKY